MAESHNKKLIVLKLRGEGGHWYCLLVHGNLPVPAMQIQSRLSFVSGDLF